LKETVEALEEIRRLAAQFGLTDAFPDPAAAEVESWLASPGIDDPELIDRTSLPFVTIDNEDSRDLDQALCIEREGRAWLVYYALADASYYVRPGSALFAEALARGSSYYLPGLSIPMLPRPLSEGIVSLNQGETRRALLMSMHLDQRGEVSSTEISLARIRSRAKLTYAGVQAYHSAGRTGPLAGHELSETLDLLREVGEARIALAVERNVVQFERRTPSVEIDGRSGQLQPSIEQRTEVDRWNEQISLMSNVEGARWIARFLPDPEVQAIFRVHPGPDDQTLSSLERTIAGIAAAHRLDPGIWRWKRRTRRRRGDSLAIYLARLPQGGPTERVRRAIERQAMLANRPSAFVAEPGRHHGIGAEPYGRFTSPMREIVGVFTHKEAIEKLTGRASDAARDLDLQSRVLDSGNRAKALQKRLTKEVYRIALDRFFEADLAARPERRGTAMGISPTKIYVELDDPPIEVKIYRDGSEPSVSIGDAVAIRVDGHDQKTGRWRFALSKVS